MLAFCQEDLVFPQLEVASQDQLLTFLAQTLLAAGRVEAGYEADLKESEEAHPSALPMASPVLALPHASLDYVKTTSLVLVTLKEPIPFINFVDGRKKLPAQIVLLTAFHEGEREVALLQAMTRWFEDRDRRLALLAAQDRAALWQETEKLLAALERLELIG